MLLVLSWQPPPFQARPGSVSGRAAVGAGSRIACCWSDAADTAVRTVDVAAAGAGGGLGADVDAEVLAEQTAGGGEVVAPGAAVGVAAQARVGEVVEIRLYERCGQDGDPRYGNRAKSAALAGELAARIGYHPGTARRELAKHLAQPGRTTADPQPEPDIQAVA